MAVVLVRSGTAIVVVAACTRGFVAVAVGGRAVAVGVATPRAAHRVVVVSGRLCYRGYIQFGRVAEGHEARGTDHAVGRSTSCVHGLREWMLDLHVTKRVEAQAMVRGRDRR